MSSVVVLFVLVIIVIVVIIQNCCTAVSRCIDHVGLSTQSQIRLVDLNTAGYRVQPSFIDPDKEPAHSAASFSDDLLRIISVGQDELAVTLSAADHEELSVLRTTFAISMTVSVTVSMIVVIIVFSPVMMSAAVLMRLVASLPFRFDLDTFTGGGGIDEGNIET